MTRENKCKSQIRTLWGIAKSPEMRLTDEELHMIVMAQTGKESLRQLTPQELRRCIYVLVQMKESSGSGRRTGVLPGNGATQNQRRKLYKVMESVGWNEKRVNGLCRKMFGVERPEWLSYLQMSKLIEAVKAISAREEEAREQV